jgi:hypothetical protein
VAEESKTWCIFSDSTVSPQNSLNIECLCCSNIELLRIDHSFLQVVHKSGAAPSEKMLSGLDVADIFSAVSIDYMISMGQPRASVTVCTLS